MCPETLGFTEYFYIFQSLLAVYEWKLILDEKSFYFDCFKFVVGKIVVTFESTFL